MFLFARNGIRRWKRGCWCKARRSCRCDRLREARQRVVSQSRIEGPIHPAWMRGCTRNGGSKERRGVGKESEAIQTVGEVARPWVRSCCCGSHQMSLKREVGLFLGCYTAQGRKEAKRGTHEGRCCSRRGGYFNPGQSGLSKRGTGRRRRSFFPAINIHHGAKGKGSVFMQSASEADVFKSPVCHGKGKRKQISW